jgi:uncharacterized protein YkwD
MRPRAAAPASIFALLCACGSAGPGGGAAEPGSTVGARPEIPAAQVEGARDEVPPATAEERAAAEALFGLVNAARAEHGVPPLVASEELAAVSRGYCVEMARTEKIAHDSPISGGPADRARRAGIPFTRLTENLALAADAATAHDGLMHSPGHRANILDPAVTEVGIGAFAVIKDGFASLLVAQMFAAPPERIDLAAAPGELSDRLNAARRTKGLAPLARHPWLDARAAEALGSCGESSLAYAPKAEDAPPFRALVAVMVEGGSLDSIGESFVAGDQLSSPHVTHFGVAVARSKGDQGGGCAVVIFAAKK